MQQDNYCVYLFGSVLNTDCPNDIDVLIVYDSAIIKPDQIYNIFSEDKNQIYRYFNKTRIHCTYLNLSEYEEAEKLKKCKKIIIEKDANNCFNWTAANALPVKQMLSGRKRPRRLTTRLHLTSQKAARR